MTLQAGISPIILLAIVSILVVPHGIYLSSPEGVGYDTEGVRWFFTASSAKVRSIATASVAVPFWIWAVYKVVSAGAHDLGAVSFALVIASCVFVGRSDSPTSKIPAISLLISNGLVSLNYVYPYFLYDLPLTFQIYLAVGVIYWALVGVWNWKAQAQEVQEENSYTDISGDMA
eukprot:CAMPEP_0194280766 /NCGR_PEP_ID=MMETSP0169-20130528/18695_1 /TAXON_ID=218684 /ORGANISM="Corethron pennatum, Strain L29A3" /LENGTH=173 /DNA_ID=CAMNT_0039025615 /DNA_START=103 /DNA_END=624 /DNA_ORIENTATION=+